MAVTRLVALTQASTTVEITMPQMGESVSEGTVLTWHKKEGERVEQNETVVEVSTDKVDAEVPAPAAGTLVKILVGEDEVVTVGQPLGEIAVGEGAAAPAEDGAEPSDGETEQAAELPEAAESRPSTQPVAREPAEPEEPEAPEAGDVEAADGACLRCLGL